MSNEAEALSFQEHCDLNLAGAGRACAEQQLDSTLTEVTLQDEIKTTEVLSQHTEGNMHIRRNADSAFLEQQTIANNFTFLDKST